MTRGSGAVLCAIACSLATLIAAAPGAGAGSEAGIGVPDAGSAYHGVYPGVVTGWGDDVTIAT